MLNFVTVTFSQRIVKMFPINAIINCIKCYIIMLLNVCFK